LAKEKHAKRHLNAPTEDHLTQVVAFGFSVSARVCFDHKISVFSIFDHLGDIICICIRAAKLHAVSILLNEI
jgi:hypothetical protein